MSEFMPLFPTTQESIDATHGLSRSMTSEIGGALYI